MDKEEVIGDTPTPVADTPHIDAINLEEERIFENAKVFADRGNGCFTTIELLSICLLSLMRDIGAPLKTSGNFFLSLKMPS